MSDQNKEPELIELDEDDVKANKKAMIKRIIYFSVLILLMIACIVVVVVLKDK